MDILSHYYLPTLKEELQKNPSVGVFLFFLFSFFSNHISDSSFWFKMFFLQALFRRAFLLRCFVDTLICSLPLSVSLNVERVPANTALLSVSYMVDSYLKCQ